MLTIRAGFVYAVNVETGKLIWKVSMSTWPGSKWNSISRTSPTYDAINNYLIICDQIGASVYAINPADGSCAWSTLINPHIFSQITGSPTLYNNVIYVGANSGEEGWQVSGLMNYVCCNFRGSFSALNAATGAIIWTTYMIPDNGGKTNQYAGAGGKFNLLYF
jgi:polyvinyl alcohol dehydrogenase (cytochrome)